MSFAYPWVLVLGLIPLMMGLWQYVREPRRTSMPFDQGPAHPHGGSPGDVHAAVQADVGGSKGWERWLRVVGLLPAALALAAVVLLAQPQRRYFGEMVREVRNIQILLDSSGSMSTPFGGKASRHEAALDAVASFVEHRKGDAFGLTIYGSEVIPCLPLTTDTKAIRSALPFLTLGSLPRDFQGGTATGHGILRLCDDFERAGPGERTIILMTDGLAGDINSETLPGLLERLQGLRVTLYVILVGDETATAKSRELCEPTGGELFEAGDPAALDAVFARVDQMSQVKTRPMTPGRQDWFLPAGLVVMALGGIQVFAMYFGRAVPW